MEDVAQITGKANRMPKKVLHHQLQQKGYYKGLQKHDAVTPFAHTLTHQNTYMYVGMCVCVCVCVCEYEWMRQRLCTRTHDRSPSASRTTCRRASKRKAVRRYRLSLSGSLSLSLFSIYFSLSPPSNALYCVIY